MVRAWRKQETQAICKCRRDLRSWLSKGVPWSYEETASLRSPWREAAKRSTYFRKEGNGWILIPKTTARGLYLRPPITKNITIEKLTLVMRCLASAETWGSAGKLRSTFIILHPISTCYPIMFRFMSGNHIDWGRQKTYWYLLNVSFWLSASKGGIPKRNS